MLTSLSFVPARARAAQNQVMGELQFSSATKVERNSGVWIDGGYVGYLKELRGNKKILLLPGDHQISVRQAGYKDFTKKIVAEPGHVQPFPVKMEKQPLAQYPAANAATLKLNITPERAAVFVDDGYIGHASDLEGRSIPCWLSLESIGSRLSCRGIKPLKQKSIFSHARNPN